MARSFGGTSDYIQCPTGFNPIPAANVSFSVAAWVILATGAGSFPMLFCPNNSGNAPDQDFIGVNIAAHAGFNIFLTDSSSVSIQSTNNTAFTKDVWTHVVGTCRANGSNNYTLSTYINGVQQSTGSGSTVGTLGTAQAWQICNGTNGGNSFWDGKVADFAVWNIDISPEDSYRLAIGQKRPNIVSPGNLLIYLPMTGATAGAIEVDQSVRRFAPSTPGGSPGYATDPPQVRQRVFAPSGLSLGMSSLVEIQPIFPVFKGPQTIATLGTQSLIFM